MNNYDSISPIGTIPTFTSLRASLDWQLLNKQNCTKKIDKIENRRK